MNDNYWYEGSIYSCLDDRKVKSWGNELITFISSMHGPYSTTAHHSNIARPAHSSSREVDHSRTGAPPGNVS